MAKWRPAGLMYLWGMTMGLGCACPRAPALGRGLFVATTDHSAVACFGCVSQGVLSLWSLMYDH